MKTIFLLFLIIFNVISCSTKENVIQLNDLNKASFFLKQYQLDKAMFYADSLDSLVKNPKNKILVYLFKPRLYYQMKEFDKCIESCDIALKIISQKNIMYKPYLKHLYILKGLSFIKTGNIEEAINIYDTIDNLNIVGQYTALSDRATYYLLLDSNNYEKALSDLNKSRSENPKAIDYYIILSYYYYFKNNDYNNALGLIQEGINLNDRFKSFSRKKSSTNFYITSAFMLESLCYYKLQDNPSAIKSLVNGLNFYDYGENLDDFFTFFEFDKKGINILRKIHKMSIGKK